MRSPSVTVILGLCLLACETQTQSPSGLLASVGPSVSTESDNDGGLSEARLVAARDKEHPTMLEATEAAFKKQIAVRKAALAKEMSGRDKASYDRFLAERKTRAAACKLEPTLLGTIEQYRAASDVSAQDELLRRLRDAAKGAGNAAMECIDALAAKVDDHGFLRSGLLVDETPRGKRALKPTIHNPGWVYILWPQIVTRWPGRPASAVGILDPTEAPWVVQMAYTFEDKVETFSQEWKFKDRIHVDEYLRLKQNHGHFLLVNSSSEPVGWVDMDACAFYQKERRWERYMKRSRDVFTKGLATALHGANYESKIICPDSGPARDCNDAIEWFDFLSMVHGTATLDHPQRDRRFPSNGMLNLYRMRSAAPDQSPSGNTVDVRIMSSEGGSLADPRCCFHGTSVRMFVWSIPDRLDRLPLAMGAGSKNAPLGRLKSLVAR